MTINDDSMAAEELLEKAELAIGDLIPGGRLDEFQQQIFCDRLLACWGIKLHREIGRVECLYCGSTWDDLGDPDEELSCCCTREGTWNPNVEDDADRGSPYHCSIVEIDSTADVLEVIE